MEKADTPIDEESPIKVLQKIIKIFIRLMLIA